jgi:D-ribulokinase
MHMPYSALFSNLKELGSSVRQRVQSIAIDGTSATALLVDRRDGRMLADPKLYNEGQPDAAVAAVHVSTCCQKSDG